jgi:hypothetical protein
MPKVQSYFILSILTPQNLMALRLTHSNIENIFCIFVKMKRLWHTINLRD